MGDYTMALFVLATLAGYLGATAVSRARRPR